MVAGENKLIKMPVNAGRLIVESAALLACPLLGTDRFVAFCKERDLDVDRDRLLRLERLGLFAPIFRVRTPDDEQAEPFYIPVRPGKNWFETGWAWDTTALPALHDTPSSDEKSKEGYYSIFQIDYLRLILTQMTLHLQLDSCLVDRDTQIHGWKRRIEGWIEYAKSSIESSRSHSFRPSIALLCQYISNRYYPKALSDQRAIRITSISSWDGWISVGDHPWNEDIRTRQWNVKHVESIFELSPEKLRHAYEALASAQSWVDPLSRWYPLVQFVSIDKRRNLKGGALQAETLREGALMLRCLHEELYGEVLPAPHEVGVTIINHMPELSVRKDIRRYLEFVVNAYGLNPQPKLALFVEGETEDQVIRRLFEELFGFSESTAWIELLNMKGVDNVTGGRSDRYRAILRLIDYLHHHQTIAFLILDNENNAERLRSAVTKTRSIFGHRKRITRPEYIKIWKKSFEFDNFSDTELACVLSALSQERCAFRSSEILNCRNDINPGMALKRIYQERAKFSLNKIELANALVDKMLSSKSRRHVENRPIVKVLRRVTKLALTNPFPTRQEIWEKNQISKVIARKK